MKKNLTQVLLIGLILLLAGFSFQDKKPLQKPFDLNNKSEGAPIVTQQDKTYSHFTIDGTEAYLLQDFEGATFPPTGWTIGTSGFWTRNGASGYGIGTGSAKFDFWNASTGVIDSLVSPTLTPSVSGDSLRFDHAYCTYQTEVDSLIIHTSTNNGATYSVLVNLPGGTVVGTGMVTAPPQLPQFTPTAAQWASKKYALPVGTNKVKFRVRSAFGNNLFLDNISLGTPLANDVGTLSIDVPPTIPPTTTTPQATVKNYGSATQSFSVTMTISPGGYSSTQNVVSLAPGATQSVNFASWNPTLGIANLKCYTQLGGDQNNSNDTLTASVNVTSTFWAGGSNMPLGRDLGTGVAYSRNDTGWLYVLGGELGTNSVQRYNMRTNVWTAMANLPLGKDRLGSALLKDSIYSIGGSTTDPNYTTDFYRYDINSNTWASRAPLPGTLGWCKGAGYQDSLIYVAGGYTGSATVNQVLLYNSKTNSWRTATPLPAIRFGGGFAVSGDTLVYVSGVDGAAIVSTVYRGVISQADRSVITWTTGASLPAPLTSGMFRFDAHSWGNKGIIITGGSVAIPFTNVSSACLVYSPGANTWTTMPSKTVAWTAGQSGAAGSGGAMRLVCAGGYNGSATITTTEMLTDPTVQYATELNISLIEEGYLNPSNRLNMRDTVRASLRNSTSPYALVSTAKGVIDSTGYSGQFYLYNVSTGTYYIQITHRNHLETWSKSGGESIIIGSKFNYDFTTAATQAFGSNMILKQSKYCIYGGDPNQDGTIDLSDIVLIFNDASLFASGYVVTDVTGDLFVDLSDLTVTFNNSQNFVGVITP